MHVRIYVRDVVCHLVLLSLVLDDEFIGIVLVVVGTLAIYVHFVFVFCVCLCGL